MLKVIGVVAAAIILVITTFIGLLWADHTRETFLPEPTGPFAVGRITRVFTSASQNTIVTSQYPKRELVAWIWYPATTQQQSDSTAKYLPDQWRIAVEAQRNKLINHILTRDLSHVRTFSVENADLSAQQQAYPVVLLRAGLAGLVTGNSSLAEDLASHGYIVVGFDAPYRSTVVVFPDGRVIQRAAEENADLLRGAEQEQLATRLVQAWTSDMSFVVDQLERLNSSNSSEKFYHRLDLHKLGVFGHSLGGATALEFCLDDPRCKAGIDIDGAPLVKVANISPTKPFMFLMVDHDKDSDTESHQIMSNIKSVYDRLPPQGRVGIMIRGANHFGFSDDGALLKAPLVTRMLGIFGILPLSGRRQLAITSYCIRTFFDIYLKGSTELKLGPQAEYPELTYLR